MKTFTFCFVSLFLCAVNASPAEELGRIVGGQILHISQAPYNVQLRRVHGGAFCGGALISPYYVLTAGHCVPGLSASDLVVAAGANLLSDAGVICQVERISVHPEYTKNTMHSDVAVIKLKSAMTGSNIQPVKLCSRAPTSNDMLDVTGWGSTVDDGPMINQMRHARFPVSTPQSCFNEFGNFVVKNMFCGGLSEAKGHCFGDSGGPALIRGELCGVNSFGYKCGEVGYQSAFTDVYAVLPFIATATSY